MVVKNNLEAVYTLNTLNKNSSALQKSLEKVSIGQKIVSAKDDSSAYSISEKMRSQIRSMDQDSRNVQNGSALLKIAAGGIDSIIDELRNLKELSIKSANDTNSDVDRLTIQKEFQQRVDNITELVNSTNYNGLTLMGGDYGIRIGGKVEAGDLSDLTKNFKPYSNSKVSSNLTSRCRLNGSYVQAQHSFQSNNGSTYKVEVNFSELEAGTDVANNLNGKGFIILCSGCSQYLNIKFDSSTDSSTYNSSPDPGNSLAREYTIGIKSLTNVSDLAAFMYNGIKSSNPANSSAGDTIVIDIKHSVNMEKQADGKYTINKGDTYALQFLTGSVENGQVIASDDFSGDPEGPWDPKTYSPLKIHHGAKANQSMNIYLNDMSLKFLRKRVIYDTDIGELEELIEEKEKYDSYKNYLITTKGVSADDISNLEALREDSEKYNAYKEILAGARAKTLDDARVYTAQKAKIAIRIVEGAIDYATEQAASIGAYLQRLEYTDKNIITSSENTQSAESVIRDADMAKEMTDYAKNNLLMQASQSMLAHANQDSSDVLGLLQ